MDQPYISQENQAVLNGWLFQEAVDLQREREDLEREKEELGQQRDELQQMKEELEQLRQQLDTEQEEHKNRKAELEKLQKDIVFAREQLDHMEKSVSVREDFERQRQERSEQLFQMKWKMLEEELMKLADERKEFERTMNSTAYQDFLKGYRNGNTQQTTGKTQGSVTADVALFFSGVRNELALKKRYRDLMKIFHPDNIAGDNDIMVEITNEFEYMKEQMCVE